MMLNHLSKKDLIIQMKQNLQNPCDHIKNIIEPTYWKNDAMQDEILKCIIYIESDSESDSDNDMASDGNETKDYQWPYY